MFIPSPKSAKYIQEFYKTQNIKDLLAYFSIYVWENLEFFRQEKSNISKTYETELTNQLIRGIAILIKKDRIPLPIRLFHSRNEKVNGSDLEIVLRLRKDENYLLACQAKRLYVENAKRNNLRAVYKEIKKEGQMYSLIDYAKKNDGFPLYMLYNYTESKLMKSIDYPEKELFGCTLLNAYYLNNFLKSNPTITPRFQDLHKTIKPFNTAKPFISISKVKGISSIKTLWGKAKSSDNLTPISDNKILNDGRWYEVGEPRFPPKRRTTLPPRSLEETINLCSNSRIIPGFNPAFRIVFTGKPIPIESRKEFEL